MSSTQHKLSKARPPRVQITYDVEIGDAQKVMELPLVVGVIGDFAQTEQPFRERKFVSIDKDNFSDIMAAMKPNANFLVDDMLSGQEGKIAVELTFQNMDDFSPDNIAQQLEPLRKLVEIREQLSDLRNRAASNERLKEQLAGILQQPGLNSEDNIVQEEDKI